MSDDLVKRLRALFDYGTVHEAADRIEQLEALMAAQGKVAIKLSEYVDELEAALRKIDAVSYYGMEGAEMECQEMHEIARKALEGKDD